MVEVKERGAVKRRVRDQMKNDLSGWMIMAPSLILFAFFIWEPLIESIRLSLYNAQGIRTTEFVGLQNYVDVFAHPDFLPAVQNTVFYALWSLLIGFLLPIGIAIIFNFINAGGF